MLRTAGDTPSVRRARATYLPVALLLVALTLAACGSNEASPPAGDTGSGATTQENDAETDSEADAEVDTETVLELTHEQALAAGRGQEMAVVCEYTYDEEERAGIKLLARSDVIPDGQTVYLSPGAVFTDIPQTDGRMSHMLSVDGSLYTWKVPGNGIGVLSPDLTNMEALKQKMGTNAHDCAPYIGPDSIFQPPTDIEFKSVD